MAKYIKRNLALDAIDNLLHDAIFDSKAENRGWINAVYCASAAVGEIPSADVRPIRHGRWSDKMVAVSLKNTVGYHEDDYRFGFQCSECGGVLNKTPYCGNCGAKMDGKDGE